MARRGSIVIVGGLVVAATFGCAQAKGGAGEPGSTGVGVLRGHLYGVGGPAPGGREAWAGTVTVSGPGLRRDIAVAADGFYSVTLAPGRYAIVGRSPRFDDGRQPCRPPNGDAEVAAGVIITRDVLCQMK
jgi:hypothetical protein